MIQAERTPDWYEKGNCWGRPGLLEIFFPTDENVSSSAAKAYCERCPVATQCLTYAVDNDIQHGVWGGLTFRERERYRRNPAAFVARKSSCEECGELLAGRQRLFCSTVCVRRASQRRKRRETAAMPRICAICGIEFQPTMPSQRLCTPDCRKEAERQRTQRSRQSVGGTRRGERRTIVCWECGAVFPRTGNSDRYCSNPCRAKARKGTYLRYNERKKFS